MQDNELFELCREVYKRTGWDGDKQFAYDDTYGDKWLRHIAEFPHESREWRLEKMIPLYTSDYLLEKLPQYIRHEKHDCRLEVSPTGYASKYLTLWAACYVNDSGVHIPYMDTDDTPLKALLKLVIALDDAGQLKEEE